MPPVTRANEVGQASPSIWLHPAFSIEYEPDGSPIVSYGFAIEREKEGRPTAAVCNVVSGSGRVEVIDEGTAWNYPHARVRFRAKDAPIARLAQQWGLEEFDKAREENFPAPGGYDLYHLHTDAWQRHVYFSHPGQYVIAACWGILTYVYPVFHSLPFIHFLGDKGSGKSQALDLLQELARDGLKVRPTPASVGDIIEARRPTLLMDQVDFLSDQMIDLLADSYRRGARRLVVLQPNGGRETREFETFGPKGFAGTQPLPDDLRDRAIVFQMSHSPRHLPPVRPEDATLQAVRAASYTWALRTAWTLPSLRDLMRGDGGLAPGLRTETWPSLARLINRPLELWLPIERLMEALRVPDDERQRAREYYDRAQVAAAVEPPDDRLELVKALWELAPRTAGVGTFFVRRSEIEAALPKGDLDFYAPRWNAWKIGRQLGAIPGVVIGADRGNRGDKTYQINYHALEELAGRYGLTETESDRVVRSTHGQT